MPLKLSQNWLSEMTSCCAFLLSFFFFTGLLFKMFYGTVLFWVTWTLKLLFIDWSNFCERLLGFVFVLFLFLFLVTWDHLLHFLKYLIKIFPLVGLVYPLQHLVQEKSESKIMWWYMKCKVELLRFCIIGQLCCIPCISLLFPNSV